MAFSDWGTLIGAHRTKRSPRQLSTPDPLGRATGGAINAKCQPRPVVQALEALNKWMPQLLLINFNILSIVGEQLESTYTERAVSVASDINDTKDLLCCSIEFSGMID
jgi:hypothetical protein